MHQAACYDKARVREQYLDSCWGNDASEKPDSLTERENQMMNQQIWKIGLTAFVLLFLGGLAVRWGTVLWSVVKASKMATHGASTLLEEGAQAIAADPPDRWAAECLHLLKAVDIRVEEPHYRPALEQVEAEIRVRLETGGWPEHQAPADAEQGAKG